MTNVTKLRPASQGISALVAREVRAEMARQGLTQRSFAARLGVPQPWVSRRVSIKADSELRLEEIADMAKALDVPVERLLAGWLPRLDSNQQPSGYRHRLAEVVELDTWRAAS